MIHSHRLSPMANLEPVHRPVLAANHKCLQTAEIHQYLRVIHILPDEGGRSSAESSDDI
jgi:hypothetical protein